MKKYASTGRQLVSWSILSSEFGQDAILCIDKGIVRILRILIGTRGLWDSTYYTALYDSGYDVPNASQMGVIREYISTFLKDTNDMNCSDFVASLDGIRDAILGTPSCCGSVGGAGGSDIPESATDTGQTGFHSGPVPDGFTTWNEYDAYKCGYSTLLVDNLIADLAWLKVGIGLFVPTYSVATTILLTTLVTPIPFDDILAIGGLIVALLISGIFTTQLVATYNETLAARDDLINTLNCADNATAARTDIFALLDTTLAARSAVVRYMVKFWFPAYLVNDLFEENPIQRAKGLPAGTCECGVCLPITTTGTYTGGITWDTAFWVPATDPPGKEVIGFAFWVDGVKCEVTIDSIIPTNINPNGGSSYQLYDDVGTLIYNSSTPPVSVAGVHGVVIQSTTVGSADVAWT